MHMLVHTYKTYILSATRHTSNSQASELREYGFRDDFEDILVDCGRPMMLNIEATYFEASPGE